ncbi:phage holin family protein [Synechococcus lacustris]|uniref:phage holin family protein n=1 Tax=Synechococcus lacustris TaxID=2116544 RepID=UPI003342CFF9
MTGFNWLLQWPIRALVLLLIASLPLGVEFEGFGAALLSAGAIGLLGSLLTLPLKALFLLPWAVTSLGGLIQPISLLFNWLITAILFGLAAGFVDGFRLKNGVFSAILGSLAYSIISMVVLSLVFGAI